MATKQRPTPVERVGYTYAEVGSQLGVSARQVKRWCDDGRLGFIRLPRGRRITAEHVAEFVASRNVAPLR